jgi:hypothetical protein
MGTDALMVTEERDVTQMEMDALIGMTPEKRATIQKNMERAFEHTRHILENLDELEKIPDGATLIFDDDREAGEKMRARGEKVVYVKKVYEYS